MKHRIKNFASIIIAVSMLLSLIPLYSTALDDEFEGMETLEEIPFEFELEPDDLPFEVLAQATLSVADIPSCISPALAESRGHVNRLYQQEPDDYTVMFQNRDGSKTVYVFSYPVKSTGMSMNTSAAIQVNGSAIAFASNNIITSRIGVDLFDYNIGYCEIQTFFGGTLTADGVNITEDARGWARSESSVGNLVYNMSGSAAAEYNMNISATANATLVPGVTITPIDPTPEGGITVMSISYSALAGYMSLKNVSNNKFLTYSGLTNSLTTTAAIYTPSSIWQVIYEGSYTFRVRCLENALDTYIGLNSSSNPQLTIGLKDDSLTHTDLFLDAVAENGQVKVTILSQEYGDMALSINNSFYTLGEGEDDFPTTCQWLITNKYNYALVTNLTKLSDTRIEQTGLGFEMDYTKIPATTVYENIGLYFDHNGEEVPLDPDSSEDAPICVINDPGVYTVYYMDIATGVKSECFTLFIYDIPTFANKLTYSIQPLSNSTMYLTMKQNSSQDSNDINISEYLFDNYTVNGYTNILESWNSISRTFVLTQTNTKYSITATLTKSQSASPQGSITSDQYNNTEYPYYLTNEEDIPNTINYNNGILTTKKTSNIDSLLELLYLGDFYYIICERTYDANGNEVVKALKYNISDNSYSIEAINYLDDAFRWNIHHVGVDAPLIKQTVDYYCGPATLLQILYGKNMGANVASSTAQINDLHGKMKTLATAVNIVHPIGTEKKTIHTSFNNYLGISAQAKCYQRLVISNPNNMSQDEKDNICRLITKSLDDGWAPFIYTEKGGAPYKWSSGSGHYVCIAGYDEVNDIVILSNCHYANSIHGIYAVSFEELLSGTHTLYYYGTPIN